VTSYHRTMKQYYNANYGQPERGHDGIQCYQVTVNDGGTDGTMSVDHNQF